MFYSGLRLVKMGTFLDQLFRFGIKGNKIHSSGLIFFSIIFIISISILPNPLHAKNNPNDPCKKALNCYSGVISNYGDKSSTQISREKHICDQFKKRCEELKNSNLEVADQIQQAYNTYQKAFKRYTAMVTTSSNDPITVQKALDAYRNSYAHYKQLKEAHQNSSSGAEKSVTLDTSGIDGITNIEEPSDMRNNVVNDLKALRKTVVPKPYHEISKIITRKGGVISDDMMRLQIPIGAVDGNKKIIIKKIHGTLPRGRSDQLLHEAWQIGTPYDFGPDGTMFNKPVSISIKYQKKAIPEGMNKSNLILVYFDGEKWSKINAIHDWKTGTFKTEVYGFPGSIIVAVGVPILIASGIYAITHDVHKKIYQLFWDPIKKNWVHKFIKPNNPMVQKYAKRIGVTSELGKSNTVVPFDDPKKLANYLKVNLTKRQPELVIGFRGRNRKQPFINLTDKYISEVGNINPVEDYLKKIDNQEKKFGDCIDVTNALVSILRSKGYKIKGVSGYLHGKHHAWSEVVIGNEIYAIDEEGRISKLDYFKKYVTYPKEGDPYRKEWDEKGTRVYQPTMLIVPPSNPIYAGDGKRHVFTLRTVGLPKNALFSWNFNNLGNSIKSRKRTFSYKFIATGNYSLRATAYWDGKETSAMIHIKVRGKDELAQTNAQCRNMRFHFKSSSEKFDFLLLTPRDLFAETARVIGHSPTTKQKKHIFKQYREDYQNKKVQYRKILPTNCLEQVKKLKLFVVWDGVHIDSRGKRRRYNRGYQLKQTKPATSPSLGGSNPFGGYVPYNGK